MSLPYFFYTVLTLTLTLGVSASLPPVTELSIVNANISPDGFTRPAVLVNGVFPAPLIAANKGANFQLNVSDQLTDSTMLTSTSVHWHGLFQEGSSWADGTAFVTQCPIQTGNSFLYNFNVPDQAGTYWYHSHLQTQYCDGLRGPLVIYDPNDPNLQLYDVDDDSTVITLADWYHTVATEAGTFPAAQSVLINGLGRFNGNPTSNLSVITVEQGKRYRMRLINIACEANFVYSIDGHNMTVIEADGVNHEALTVDSIQILAGQRYSFILDASQPVNNYWIRALPSASVASPANFDSGINSAILRYVGATAVEPTTSETTSVAPLQEVNLHPIDNPAAPGSPGAGGADMAFSLDINFDPTALQFSVNNVSYASPTTPVLLQILSGAQTAQDLMPAGSVYSLPANKVIEISFPMESATSAGAPHPIHLHGHTFSVVRSAGSQVYNYENPVRRDTVNVGGQSPSQPDNVTIRFETDNPGPWFLHCHIDWHLQAGFAVVMAEDIADTKSAITSLPPAWDQLCSSNSSSS